MKLLPVCFLLTSLLFIIACNDNDTTADPPVPQTPVLSYSILSVRPHDTSWFTQGYEFHQDLLYIGTGNYGVSKLMQVQPATGKVVKQVSLPDKEFGEGITILNDTLYQLTWKEHLVHTYHAATLQPGRSMTLNGEGWGLTNDGSQLVVSDGSNRLYFYEPATFRLAKTVSVMESGTPAVNLNELEYVNGFIYANQWQYNSVLKIDPASGNVVARIDFTDLVNRVQSENPYLDTRNSAVLNGIAYHPASKKFWITGKLWPHAYEVDFQH
ncbi:MAG TPA: glutaminyl-peptide cyclotransferase [Flavisolibacter sp.]